MDISPSLSPSPIRRFISATSASLNFALPFRSPLDPSHLHEGGYEHLKTLTLEETDGRWTVYCREHELGYLKTEDLWLLPLRESGATVELLRISGADKETFRLGVHVLFGALGQAMYSYDRRK